MSQESMKARTATEQVAWEKRQKRRDKFICAAMTGYLESHSHINRENLSEDAYWIVRFADAVLAEADKVRT